ncbi:30S ribosomal protein S16 [Pseudobythopirellula maris]|uniref:30S ribosomal protein S16 n=1 Tax=Pseudobythopirellula maris TaxID=2527991 RepID=UPI001E65D568|nr:30S ribosomal protein S16 [Pseudobythopirellula maris]
MSVRIRMKKMGRSHRHFFRICAMDKRSPRDGKVLEELGTYDPHVGETDARASLNKERIDYWLSVGAQPSENVAVLIKKYGTDGTHADAQREALGRLSLPADVSDPDMPEAPKPPEPEPAEEAAAEGEASEDKPTDEAASEAPAEEAKADEAPAEEKKEEASAE